MAALGGHGASTVHVAEDDALGLSQPMVDARRRLLAARAARATCCSAPRSLASDVAAGARGPARRRPDHRRDRAARRGRPHSSRAGPASATPCSRTARFTPATRRDRGARQHLRAGRRAARPAGASRCAASRRERLVRARRRSSATSRPRPPRVDISEADVLVGGGRGSAARELRLCEDLASALGGEVAATRAVVDAGWYPYATQVGQTGKTVVAEALRRLRHLRRDPAQGRHAGVARRSSRSTRTRTRRSSTSPTSASSATCTRSSRS